MGTVERDWVQVANDLLFKCHTNLRLRRLTDCDANVFITLYEGILSDKVPDFIALPSSQEDDIHNVQSVIDSLALDYLHISLSHITGENIVRGDHESVRNLLEIFDGLLEYLTEQLSEDEEQLQNGGVQSSGEGEGEEVQGKAAKAARPRPGPGEGEREDVTSQASSLHSAVPSSRHSVHSWNGEESESTAELIRLGDSARTFSKKEDPLPAPASGPSGPPDGTSGDHGAATPSATATNATVRPAATTVTVTASDSATATVLPDSSGSTATLLREPAACSAIPLQPPYQTTPQRQQRPTGHTGAAAQAPILPHSHSPASSSLTSPDSLQEQQPPDWQELPLSSLQNGHSSRSLGDVLRPNHLLSPSSPISPVTNERSVSSQRRVNGEGKHEAELSPSMAEAAAAVAAAAARSRRVLFRTQPDVLLLSLREELEGGGGALPNGHADHQEEGVGVRVNGERSRAEEEELELEAELEAELELEESLLLQQQPSSSSAPRRRREHGRGSRHHRGPARREREGAPEGLSRRSQRNKEAEEELHHMSEKLARRLEELDDMLKRALGESCEGGEAQEEAQEEEQQEQQSHHSDSIMECRRPDLPLTNGVMRTRSLSPSPPPPSRRAPLEGSGARDGRRHRVTRACHRDRRDLEGQRRPGETVVKNYEEELKRYEDEERAKMAKERLLVQETEREYREVLRREGLRSPRSPEAVAAAGSPRTPTSHGPRTPASRSTSHTRHRHTLPRRPPSMRVKDNDLLPTLLEDFPGLSLSPHAFSSMWKQQLRQVDHLNAPHNQRSRHKLTHEVDEAQKRHDLLVEIIRKDQEHNRRLKDHRERVQQQKSTQNRLREQRQQVARAKKYYSDYHLQLRSRLARARTREERMFKQIFEEGVELQKARLREERAYAKEQRQEQQRRQRAELEAMENYYRDQLSLLAETLAQERQDIQVRKKAQEKALVKVKRELRSKMEREIGELQRMIIQNDEDDYFRDMEAERLRRRLHMASFQYNTSCLH
ncbi:centrosomal protein of 95 kDa-like isoform X2 [Engraulis encrasicolus]|uniref:centrosomal protein of 95 kDa-like isoform X2 n=1 Tax=Engraulis encrasicolus TaxID=184585 RepID=UPI002FCFF449